MFYLQIIIKLMSTDRAVQFFQHRIFYLPQYIAQPIQGIINPMTQSYEFGFKYPYLIQQIR